MVRARFARVVLGFGICLFGVAMATRAAVNPWLSNAGVAAVVVALSAAVLRRRLAVLLVVRWRALVDAVLLAVVMVAATHASFALAAALIPGLTAEVGGLYRDVAQHSPGTLASIGLLVLVVVAEEMLWRGLAVELCPSALGRLRVGVVVVLLYALPQLIAGEWVLMAAAIGAGAIFTAQRFATGGLLAPITTHAIWSACVFLLVPLSD